MHSQTLDEMLAAPSYWHTRLSCRSARVANLPLESDVVIIGGGISGLAAALQALESGYSVTVLEAKEVGGGASGRNSGFVVPVPSRHSAQSLQNLLRENTVPFMGALRESAQKVFECTRSASTVMGWVQPLVQPASHGIATELAKSWMRLGVKVKPIGAEAMSSELGTTEYAEGLHFSDAGAIDPLELVYQLADAVNRKGGQVLEHCCALNVRATARWVGVLTEQGEIRAGRVFIAGNAYGSAASRQTRRGISPLVLTLATFVVPHSGGGLLPFSDNRKDMWFARRLSPTKLLTGCFALPFQRSGAACSKLLQARIKHLYGTEVQAPEYQWAGWVGLTSGAMPLVHAQDERVIGWSGCNGRGIALSMLMGKTLMDQLLGGRGLPLPRSSGAYHQTANVLTWLAQMVIALDRRKQHRSVLAS